MKRDPNRIKYRELAEYLNRSIAGIKKMKKNYPDQLELLLIGLRVKWDREAEEVGTASSEEPTNKNKVTIDTKEN